MRSVFTAAAFVGVLFLGVSPAISSAAQKASAPAARAAIECSLFSPCFNPICIPFHGACEDVTPSFVDVIRMYAAFTPVV